MERTAETPLRLAGRLGFVALVEVSQWLFGLPPALAWLWWISWPLPGPPPFWTWLVTAGIVMTGGWPGALLAKRVVRGARHTRGFLVAAVTALGKYGGFYLLSRARDGGHGAGSIGFPWFREDSAVWLFLVVLPYAYGVAATFIDIRWEDLSPTGRPGR